MLTSRGLAAGSISHYGREGRRDGTFTARILRRKHALNSMNSVSYGDYSNTILTLLPWNWTFK